MAFTTRTVFAAIALWLGIIGSGPANATFLFQSIPDLTIDPFDEARCSACANFGTYEVWDTFTLTNPATITNIQFVVSAAHDFPSKPNVLIYSYSNGLPGSLIWSQQFGPTCTNGACPWKLYTYTLTQFDTAVLNANPDLLQLDAGTYDISFYNLDGLYIPNFRGGSGLFMQSVSPFIGGTSGCTCTFYPGLSLGFWLQGNILPSPANVAEPSTFGILFVGLLLLGGVRRRGVLTTIS